MATSTFRTIQTNFAEGIQFTKNYIPNATFQNGSINNWSKFTTTLTSGLPTGALTLNSAASITTFTATTTTPISGSTSMQIGSSGAWSAGQGIITAAFTIEREDLGKPLTFSLSFEAITNPTNANWSGTLGSQSFAVYVYDATTSTWIQPSGFLGMNQSSGVGRVMGSFQSSVTSGQQYRLAIIALQATSGAITLNIDNVFLGKEISTVGTPITDFVSYTPTTSWTTGFTITGQYRRIGDSLECNVKLTCTGAPLAASETTFSIPPGYTIDTTKLTSPVAAGTAPVYGDAIGYDLSTTNIYILKCQYWSTTTVKLYYQSTSTGQETAVTTSLPPTWSTGDTIIARFVVPIVGLSSSVQMSNATDTRVVAATASITGTFSNSYVQLGITSTKDTHGAIQSNTYVIPVSGFYSMGVIATSGASLPYPANSRFTIGYSINSPTVTNGFAEWRSSAAATVIPTAIGSDTVYCNAGDIIRLFGINDAGSQTLSPSKFWINRLSGPSVVASSESVYASYWLPADVTASTTAPINFSSREFDSHLAVTTGANWRFTAPISGTFQVNIFVAATTANLATWIYKNGTIYKYIMISQTAAYNNTGATLIQLNAGDYIDIRPDSSRTIKGGTLSGGLASLFSIVRVGN